MNLSFSIQLYNRDINKEWYEVEVDYTPSDSGDRDTPPSGDECEILDINPDIEELTEEDEALICEKASEEYVNYMSDAYFDRREESKRDWMNQ